MPIINTVKGNLITLAKTSRYTEIAHGCNCFCAMRAGIAPQIAKAFPDAERKDNRTIRGDKSKLGNFTIGFHGLDEDELVPELAIFNMYIQYGTGGRTRGEPDIDYSALERAFTKLDERVGQMKKERDCAENYENQLLGIPLIGAGLAGGDWKVIDEIINRVTPDTNIELVIYKT